MNCQLKDSKFAIEINIIHNHKQADFHRQNTFNYNQNVTETNKTTALPMISAVKSATRLQS